MTEPIHTPWMNLVISLTGVEESIEQELIGGLVEMTEALGASDAKNASGKTEWRLTFPAEVNREEIEEVLQSYLLQGLDDVIGMVGVSWKWREQPDENWSVAYRDYFQPVVLRPFQILAPWHKKPEENLLTIVINPGQGFGTGTHETTQLCLEMLPALVRETTSVMDVGSGSGILSIAAALLGAREVTAVEIDPAANQNALENLDLNGLEKRVRIVEGGPELVGEATFDLVVCNMLLVNACKLFPQILKQVGDGGSFVLGGFLTRETEQARELFASAGGMFVDYAEKGDWGRLVWRK